MLRVVLVVALTLGWTLLPAEAAAVTLSCDGTSTIYGGKREPVTKIGVSVDLDARTVTLLGAVASINTINGNLVWFGSNWGVGWQMSGSIDRITGSLIATTTLIDQKTNQQKEVESYDLICKPTKPLF